MAITPATMNIHLGVRGKNLPVNSSFCGDLLAFFRAKYGEKVAVIALLKSISVVSASFKVNSKLWILHVAPSRHLKSTTSLAQKAIFASGRIVYAGSDFTIHSIRRDYDEGKKLNDRCLSINDLTLLLASKETRAKSRLIDGLAELFSEGRFIYSDFEKRFEIKARFSLIANITHQSYLMNRKSLLGNTFLERCLVVYSRTTLEEMREANLNRDVRNKIVAPRYKGKLRESDVSMTMKDLRRLNEIAERWQIAGGYSSSSQTFDMVKSVAVGFAILAGHRKIGLAEFHYLNQLEPHVNINEAAVLEKIAEL